jgi:predicted transcriptional regulator
MDRMAREISLPQITCLMDEKTKFLLSDISKHQPTTITEIAKRTDFSESTISRFIARLIDMNAVKIAQKGKIKEITVSFTGNVLLRSG